MYPDPDASGGDGEHLEPTIVEVNTARICPKFSEEGLYFVKFPNFLSIEPRPFDQEHYEDEFDEDDLLDEEGRARLKLRVCNFPQPIISSIERIFVHIAASRAFVPNIFDEKAQFPWNV